MANVTMRELRNQGGAVIERVLQGEVLTVTRDGRPVAELRPIRSPARSAAVIVEHWQRLPGVDPALMRRDIDRALDPSL